MSVVVNVTKCKKLREEWKNVEFVLIYEVSLVSLKLLSEIDHALRYAKQSMIFGLGELMLYLQVTFCNTCP